MEERNIATTVEEKLVSLIQYLGRNVKTVEDLENHKVGEMLDHDIEDLVEYLKEYNDKLEA